MHSGRNRVYAQAMKSNTWWIGPLVLVVFRVLLVEAGLSRAKLVNGTMIFRGALSLRIMFLAGIIGFTVAILASLGSEEPWILIVASSFVLLWCFSWLPTITIAADAIRRVLWWRPTVVIPWQDVTALEECKGGELAVFGRNGQCIVFNRYHVDPSAFRREVLKRAKLDRTMDGSAPPTLRG